MLSAQQVGLISEFRHRLFCPAEMGVLAYGRKPVPRGRPNERFLQNTLKSVSYGEPLPALKYCPFHTPPTCHSRSPLQCRYSGIQLTRLSCWMQPIAGLLRMRCGSNGTVGNAPGMKMTGAKGAVHHQQASIHPKSEAHQQTSFAGFSHTVNSS